MNDSIVLAVITFGVIGWVVLAAIEAFYNRCKQKQLLADYKEAIQLLSAVTTSFGEVANDIAPLPYQKVLATRYDWQAAAIIRKYHERGGK